MVKLIVLIWIDVQKYKRLTNEVVMLLKTLKFMFLFAPNNEGGANRKR